MKHFRVRTVTICLFAAIPLLITARSARAQQGAGLPVLAANVQTIGATSPAACTLTAIGSASAGGYQFFNFDGPLAGTNAGAGTNMNGISNTGNAVGFTINNDGAFANFVANPRKTGPCTALSINGSTTAMASGINLIGSVVGTDGNGHAVFLPPRNTCRRNDRDYGKRGGCVWH
jgi:hypothetical protein